MITRKSLFEILTDFGVSKTIPYNEVQRILNAVEEWQYKNNERIIVYDKERKIVVQDEDGQGLLFKDETEARNFFFELQYKEDWAKENIEFIPVKIR